MNSTYASAIQYLLTAGSPWCCHKCRFAHGLSHGLTDSREQYHFSNFK